MSNVVLGLCGLKILRHERRSMGSRERSEQSNPLKISNLSLMKKAVSYVTIGQNLGGLWLMLVWNFENVFAI